MADSSSIFSAIGTTAERFSSHAEDSVASRVWEQHRAGIITSGIGYMIRQSVKAALPSLVATTGDMAYNGPAQFELPYLTPKLKAEMVHLPQETQCLYQLILHFYPKDRPEQHQVAVFLLNRTARHMLSVKDMRHKYEIISTKFDALYDSVDKLNMDGCKKALLYARALQKCFLPIQQACDLVLGDIMSLRTTAMPVELYFEPEKVERSVKMLRELYTYYKKYSIDQMAIWRSRDLSKFRVRSEVLLSSTSKSQHKKSSTATTTSAAPSANQTTKAAAASSQTESEQEEDNDSGSDDSDSDSAVSN